MSKAKSRSRAAHRGAIRKRKNPEDFRDFRSSTDCKNYNGLTRINPADNGPLLGRHANRAVEADRFTVEHLVLNDVRGKSGEFVSPPEP